MMKNLKPFKKNQLGFSLIELLLVIVIIGIIATIALARFQAAVKASNEASALSGVKLIYNAQATYRSNHNLFGTIDNLMQLGAIDEAFDDTDGNPNTGERSGYLYQITFTGESCIISAIPQAVGITGTGSRRLGANGAGSIYRDNENLTTHYATEAELTSGTSVPYGSN